MNAIALPMPQPMSRRVPPSLPRLLLRGDLIRRQLQMGARTIWVIKDPIAGEFFYFNEREFTILSALDGRTADEIAAHYRKHHGNDVLSPDQLVSFLAQVQRSGLLQTSGALSEAHGMAPTRSRGVAAGLMSPLAIRLPDIDPSPLLDWIEPKTRWIFAPMTLGLSAVWMLLAAVIVGLRGDLFLQELQQSQAWASAGMMFVVIAVIAITKVVHELAHALAARRYGGSCTEIGLMFLVLIPCLYCDVSDAWLQPQRSKRIAISAAGMLAELWIAATAAILWAVTIPGPLHWGCLSIVVVCSVSTLLFNGNPLMRYDGYYILSDLLRIPNLASESSQALMQRIKRLLTGIDPAMQGEPSPHSQPMLIGYAVTSLCYRIVVITAILFAIHKMAMVYELRIVAWCVTAPMLFGITRAVYRSSASLRMSPMQRRAVRRGRVALGSIVAMVIGLGVMLFPLPHQIKLPFIAKAVDQQDLFVTQPGTLMSAVDEGTHVQAGEIIARLQNREIDLELETLAAEAISLNERLIRVRSLRSDDPKVAAQIPALVDWISATEEKIALRTRERTALQIAAPQAGLVFAAPRRPQTAGDQGEPAWTGTLLQPHNVGCFVPRGTQLCSLGSAAGRTVALLASHREIGFVRLGQTVDLHLPGAPGGRVRGTVSRIDPQPLAHVPRELVVNQQVSVEPADRGGDLPLEPTYQFLVAIEDDSLSIPLRATGSAQVHVGSQSLLGHLARFLADSLRFELNP